ncbi:hypothetical protein MA16_Dca022120 [Dendrobium catenatum]|uniref:Uncharacterized protein n=1 Tax=Dendrobium catenatum TaxID=906689 RepID=A0A2I0VJ72_9ASPA|nr:hypothetical protein MA16_Dca022120 [Dendrobium catenatum]
MKGTEAKSKKKEEEEKEKISIRGNNSSSTTARVLLDGGIMPDFRTTRRLSDLNRQVTVLPTSVTLRLRSFKLTSPTDYSPSDLRRSPTTILQTYQPESSTTRLIPAIITGLISSGPSPPSEDPPAPSLPNLNLPTDETSSSTSIQMPPILPPPKLHSTNKFDALQLLQGDLLPLDDSAFYGKEKQTSNTNLDTPVTSNKSQTAKNAKGKAIQKRFEYCYPTVFGLVRFKKMKDPFEAAYEEDDSPPASPPPLPEEEAPTMEGEDEEVAPGSHPSAAANFDTT